MYDNDTYRDPEEFYESEISGNSSSEDEIERELVFGNFVGKLGMIKRTILLMSTGHLRPKNYKDRWPANAARIGKYLGELFYGKPLTDHAIWKQMREINKMAAGLRLSGDNKDASPVEEPTVEKSSRIPYMDDIMVLARKHAKKAPHIEENDFFQEAIAKLLGMGQKRILELNKEMILLISHGAMIDLIRREKRHMR